jgi:hypothetical protein
MYVVAVPGLYKNGILQGEQFGKIVKKFIDDQVMFMPGKPADGIWFMGNWKEIKNILGLSDRNRIAA